MARAFASGRLPAWTPVGRPTLRKRPKTRMNALYLGAVASQLLHAAAVALAAAPGLKRIHCVVEREGIGLNAHEPIYRGTISQELIDSGENEPRRRSAPTENLRLPAR